LFISPALARPAVATQVRSRRLAADSATELARALRALFPILVLSRLRVREDLEAAIPDSPTRNAPWLHRRKTAAVDFQGQDVKQTSQAPNIWRAAAGLYAILRPVLQFGWD
jgi:hypothetical protein